MILYSIKMITGNRSGGEIAVYVGGYMTIWVMLRKLEFAVFESTLS